jgi:hypothetical protein
MQFSQLKKCKNPRDFHLAQFELISKIQAPNDMAKAISRTYYEYIRDCFDNIGYTAHRRAAGMAV